jgi:uncharacterized coiled-coil protein SlyX
MSDSLEDRVRSLEVRVAMNEQRTDTMTQDIKEIKNTLTWLNRMVVGAIVVAALNLVLKMG